MTQKRMDLEEKPSTPVLEEILKKYPRLAALPRYGWRNKRAWKRLRLARKFLLDKDGETYLVDQGGWTRNMVRTDAKLVHASKLLDPAKKTVR